MSQVPCPVVGCRFKAKNKAGLGGHRRAKHPDSPRGPVEVAVRRDLKDVAGLGGLQAAAVKLASKIDLSESARDLSGLVAELRQTLATLGVTVAGEKVADAVDELNAKRAARHAGAADQVGS